MSDETAGLTASDIEALIQDLLSSTEHCAARDVIAAVLITNLREEINALTPITHSEEGAEVSDETAGRNT